MLMATADVRKGRETGPSPGRAGSSVESLPTAFPAPHPRQHGRWRVTRQLNLHKLAERRNKEQNTMKQETRTRRKTSTKPECVS